MAVRTACRRFPGHGSRGWVAQFDKLEVVPSALVWIEIRRIAGQALQM